MKTITVLLADDHMIMRQGIRALLEREGDIQVVGEACNGREAVSLTLALCPKVVLLDISMPLLNGLEAARQLVQLMPKAKIIMLSAFAYDVYVDQAIALGAKGYLTKQSASCTLAKAIRHVHQGGSIFSPEISERLNVPAPKIFHSPKTRTNQATQRLSSREMEVLQLIAEGKMNKETADELGISIKTVENHRQSLIRKLGIHDTASLTRYAISVGIIESGLHLITTDETHAGKTRRSVLANDPFSPAEIQNFQPSPAETIWAT